MGLTWRDCVLPWRQQSCGNNRISPRWGSAFAGHSFRRAMPCAVDGRLSKNVFTKYKGNALSSEEFADFINKNGIDEFYIAGADAIACVKSTYYNLMKANYKVNVLSDCITSYDKKKIDEMLHYYESKGCKIISLNNLL